MLWQIQETQDTMRISSQLHMERKYYVLGNSENIVIPQQLMTSLVRLNYIVKHILTSDMFRPEFIQ